MDRLTKTALVFAGSGVAGFLGEREVAGPSASYAGRRWPFLPAYATGGAVVSLVEPSLRGMPWWQRAAVYGAGLSGVEYAACKLDRATGHKAWDYPGCTTWKHAILWAGLGMLAENIVRRF